MKPNPMLKSLLATVLAIISVGAQAIPVLFVDFTGKDWKDAIEPDNSKYTAQVGDISVTTIPEKLKLTLTFNSSTAETNGCTAANQGLACVGDGIGVIDDEVGLLGLESLRVSFLNQTVDILGVELLDLYGNETFLRRIGETALIVEAGGNIQSFTPSFDNNGVAGGYWNTGFTATGISDLYLTAKFDGFSDYSLARIKYQVSTEHATAVPEPGTLSLLGVGLLGLGLIRRRVRA